MERCTRPGPALPPGGDSGRQVPDIAPVEGFGSGSGSSSDATHTSTGIGACPHQQRGACSDSEVG
jgi:hypothetical protein